MAAPMAANAGVIYSGILNTPIPENTTLDVNFNPATDLVVDFTIAGYDDGSAPFIYLRRQVRHMYEAGGIWDAKLGAQARPV